MGTLGPFVVIEQIHKYTPLNIDRYIQFCQYLTLVDTWMKCSDSTGKSTHRNVMVHWEESNTSQDLCSFMSLAIAAGYFVPGDVLIYDNAKVHLAANTRDELEASSSLLLRLTL